MRGKLKFSIENARKILENSFYSFLSKEAFNAVFNTGIMGDTLGSTDPAPWSPHTSSLFTFVAAICS